MAKKIVSILPDMTWNTRPRRNTEQLRSSKLPTGLVLMASCGPTKRKLSLKVGR